MLSAAHILAMDAKNLLDVIDSIRIRYPDIFYAKPSSNSQISGTFVSICDLKDNDDSPNSTNDESMMNKITVEEDWSEQQTYQNITKICDEQKGLEEDIYVNQKPIQANGGIYDSSSQVVQTADDLMNKASSKKPPIAAKPSNILMI